MKYFSALETEVLLLRTGQDELVRCRAQNHALNERIGSFFFDLVILT